MCVSEHILKTREKVLYAGHHGHMKHRDMSCCGGYWYHLNSIQVQGNSRVIHLKVKSIKKGTEPHSRIYFLESMI